MLDDLITVVRETYGPKGIVFFNGNDWLVLVEKPLERQGVALFEGFFEERYDEVMRDRTMNGLYEKFAELQEQLRN